MLKIWTDGSCLGNPGVGGWAFIATNGKEIAERTGHEESTTNNRMELTAVIKALTAVHHRHSEVELYTDSQYVKNGMEIWMDKWEKNNWCNAKKRPIKNQDLWRELDKLCRKLQVKWHWVRGHVGNKMNERVDALARTAAESWK